MRIFVRPKVRTYYAVADEYETDSLKRNALGDVKSVTTEDTIENLKRELAYIRFLLPAIEETA
jgi:hypothetical protein